MAETASDDMTSINGQKQVNDIMKRVLFDDIDRDGSYFSYLFMEKIFGENRTCQFCGAYGSGRVPSGTHSPELYVIEEGIVGKQVVECVRCKKQETVLSHDHVEIPSDQRLRIRGLEVRYYCKKITHFEVLHDLLELLHVAAIEDEKKKKDKHVDVASFMMQKAKRVCEEWCKAEYTELRYRKYLRLRHETLLDVDYTPVFPPDASEEYKEMYRMMASSFRSNKDKVIRLLELMKESLFDNPTRPSFMVWVSIAMMHSEQYQDFKSQYDLHTYKAMESGTYASLKERFLSLNIPVGIKKIPVVFILFELPRFYHYVDFLTRRMGKRKPLNFLTDSEKEELKKIDMEKGPPLFDADDFDMDRVPRHYRYDDIRMRHKYERDRREREERPPRVVTSEQFRGHLLDNLQHKKPEPKNSPAPPILGDQPNWATKCRLILKIETEPTSEPDLTPYQLKDTIRKLSTMPSQSSENVKLTVSSQVGPGLHLATTPAFGSQIVFKDPVNHASLTLTPRPSMGIHSPISIPVPTATIPNEEGPLYASVETIENVPTERLLAATSTHGFDLEALKKEMRLPDTKILQNIDENEMRHTPSKVLSRIVESCSDTIHLSDNKESGVVSNPDSKGPVPEQQPSYLKKCSVVTRPGLSKTDELPYGVTRELLGDDREVVCEIPMRGPRGDFTVSPLMFATDIQNQPMPVLPFIFVAAKKRVTRRSLEIVARLFGVPVGDEIPEIQRLIFEKYLKIAIVVARRNDLFADIGHLGAIKSVTQKGLCTIVRLNLPAVISEADYEVKEMAEGRGIFGPKALTSGTEPEKTLQASAEVDCDPQVTVDTLEDQPKKKRKRKKKNKKKAESIVENGDEDDEQSDHLTNAVETEEEGKETAKMTEVQSRKTAREKFHHCDQCQTPITGSIRLCSGCKKVCYCNRDCQKAHWKEHKKTCSYVLRKELTG